MIAGVGLPCHGPGVGVQENLGQAADLKSSIHSCCSVDYYTGSCIPTNVKQRQEEREIPTITMDTESDKLGTAEESGDMREPA